MNPFLLASLAAATTSSIASGIVGTYVVIKRIVFICGSIAHSVLGGMGLFLFLNRRFDMPIFQPLYGALLMALLSAYLIGAVRLHYREREDTIIGALWASGMAMGVIFISLTPGYNVEMMNFLFGNILWTTPSDIGMLIGLDTIVLISAALFHRRFLAICFDENQARLQGLKVNALTYLLLTLVALTVVLLIQVVGAILLIALLTLPAAIANQWTQRLSKMMTVAVLLCLGISFLGTYLAFAFNWPPGATIALTASIVYFISILRRRL